MGTNKTIEEASRAIDENDLITARTILSQIIQTEPNNDMAWTLFARVAKEQEQSVFCLERAIQINPKNLLARTMLDEARISPYFQEIKDDTSQEIVATPSITEDGQKRCPYCAELIQDAAIICRYCNYDLRVGEPISTRVADDASRTRYWNPGVAALISLIIPGGGSIYKGKLVRGLFWLFVVPVAYLIFVGAGVIAHLACIVDAYTGDPFQQYKEKTVESKEGVKFLIGLIIFIIILGIVAYNLLY